MKKRCLIPAALLCVTLFALLMAVHAKKNEASICIQNVNYVMGKFTLDDFLQNDFSLADPVELAEKSVRYDYNGLVLDPGSYYDTPLTVCIDGSSEQPLSVWLCNPGSDSISLREGQICALSCDLDVLDEMGISVEIGGVSLTGMTREELTQEMEYALHGFAVDVQNSDPFVLVLFKLQSSYLFRFDESKMLTAVEVRKIV